MNNNILLIFNNLNNCEPLINVFKQLKRDDYYLNFWTSDPFFTRIAKEESWTHKTNSFGPTLSGSIKPKRSLSFPFKFYFQLPFLYFKYFGLIAYYKFAKKINAIIIWDWNARIVISPLAKIFNIRMFWLHCPSNEIAGLDKFTKKITRWLSKAANNIVFLHKTKEKLIVAGYLEKNIKIIPLGIKQKSFEHQENIFDSLAQADHAKSGKKFFTLGTILDLQDDQKLETAFQAVKIARAVIPNIQLIVVGEGNERKQLIWLTKKMEIENLVWFISRQKHISKWLSGFDAYINIKEILNIEDINILLKAMASSLPIIGPRDIGLEDFISGNNNGLLFNSGDSDELAGHIINLKQNLHFRKTLGASACESHYQFTFDKMYEKFLAVLRSI